MSHRIARRLYLPSIAIGAGGAMTAGVGILQDHADVFRTGITLLIAAIPALSYCLAYRAELTTDMQLAEARRDGYRLALHHVHMGLLDQPSAPPDGGESVEEEDTLPNSIVRGVDLPDNVRPIRTHATEDNTRKVV
ncbi:hypothetical protein ACFWHG_09630 [Streptomyces microflavus]|uniref:hypothetical protein n=1 Tax=Streptomyces microflavus TaxID=1919 RepID=UPI0036547AB6